MNESGSSYSRGRTSPEKALQKLKHFCGYQERSQADVRQKLYSLGLFKNEVEELISQLIEAEYLNEQRYATLFASGKARIKGWGKVKIRYELKQHGISAVCIAQALQALDEPEYQKSFERQAAKKWLSLKGEKNIFVRKTKWQNHLLQKGFEPALFKGWIPPDKDQATHTAD